MKNVFIETKKLDENVRDTYGLTEDIMMENAVYMLETECNKILEKASNINFYRKAVLILCGKGNNGGDVYALSRRLISENLSVTVCVLEEAKTEIAKVQENRAKKSGVNFISPYELDDFIAEKSLDLKLVVDCIYGTGFHGELSETVKAVLKAVNSLSDVKRIACDIPTGLDKYGASGGVHFMADVTVTMGALKLGLFSDEAKDACGKIVLGNLGVSQKNFEAEGKFSSDAKILEESDLHLPVRKKQNVNKGTFGTAAIVCGEKGGAAVIAGCACLKFGAGKVFIQRDEDNKNFQIPYELMETKEFPAETKTVAFGMGLGRNNKNAGALLNYILENKNISAVLDADIFYHKEISSFLKNIACEKTERIVLTPHPKEFCELLKICEITTATVSEVCNNRYDLMKEFCQKFPNVVLLVKGANTFIAHKAYDQNFECFINTLGSSSLAKAGSGDVLTGLVSALLAQNYSALDAAISSSLSHSLASNAVENNYSLTPLTLIEKISSLRVPASVAG